LVEGLLGFPYLLALWVEFEIGFELGDGFVFFLELLRCLREDKMSVGVVGLDLDGVFGTQIGALKVLVTHVEFGDCEVLVNALIVGLHSFWLGELAMRRGALGAFVFEGWADVGRGVGIAAAGAA